MVKMGTITPRLARALEAVASWPTERQDAAADVLERLDELTSDPIQLDPDERADLEQALDEVRRGEFASDQEVAAMFSRHGV
jgi:uncharacterized protein HemX